MTVYNMPGGSVIYGGVTPQVKQSADGWLYVVYCGERVGRQFGTHVYRIWPHNQHTEWVELPVHTPNGSAVHVEPDGLYISFPVNKERQVQRIKVPGFVTQGYPTNGKTSANPAPLPQPTSSVDQQARNDIAALRTEINQLRNQLAQANNRIAALEARPQATGVTVKQVEDIAWAKGRDSQFYELNQPNSPAVNLIRRIVQQMISGR